MHCRCCIYITIYSNNSTLTSVWFNTLWKLRILLFRPNFPDNTAHRSLALCAECVKDSFPCFSAYNTNIIYSVNLFMIAGQHYVYYYLTTESFGYLSFPSPFWKHYVDDNFTVHPYSQAGAGVPQPPQQHRSMYPVHLCKGDRRWKATILRCICAESLTGLSLLSVLDSNTHQPIPALWLTSSCGTTRPQY